MTHRFVDDPHDPHTLIVKPSPAGMSATAMEQVAYLLRHPDDPEYYWDVYLGHGWVRDLQGELGDTLAALLEQITDQRWDRVAATGKTLVELLQGVSVDLLSVETGEGFECDTEGCCVPTVEPYPMPDTSLEVAA